MWQFLARSSRGTGPKMRVPIGSDALLTITAAFLSKRISDLVLALDALAGANDDGLQHIALLHPAGAEWLP